MTKGIDKYSIDSTDYTVGQDNVQKWGFDVHNPVFGISAGLIALFLIGILITDTASAKAALDGVKGQIINSFLVCRNSSVVRFEFVLEFVTLLFKRLIRTLQVIRCIGPYVLALRVCDA